jgi:hypothetical protein
MTMPRLSLYRPEKGNDFRMIDRVIYEQFQVGGTDIIIHKYLGPADPLEGEATPATPVNTNPIPELGIQDVLFMENRDRKYEPDVYVSRGIYTMQDIDFNLQQFGFFLSNDNIMITFHLRGIVELLGRKLMAGDVLELPHLKDEYALGDDMVALKRFYVVSDVARPASGYSQTWYPHLLRAKCEPLVDSQEYKQILDQDSGDGQNSLRDILSTYNQNIAINNQIIAQAEADAGLSGYDTDQYYILPLQEDGKLDIRDTTDTDVDASYDGNAADASSVFVTPEKDVYISYLQGDGKPPNGAPYSFGIEYPVNPGIGAYHLRTDYMPNRLFRFSGNGWVYVESNVRMTMTNKPVDGIPAPDALTRHTQLGSFINNNNTATIAGKVIEERQSLSKALKKRQGPEADL